MPGAAASTTLSASTSRTGAHRGGKAGYQHDFALQLAKLDAAFAIEPMGFGCRRDPINAAKLVAESVDPAAEGHCWRETMIPGEWDVSRTLTTSRPALSWTRPALGSWASPAANGHPVRDSARTSHSCRSRSATEHIP